MAFNLDEIPVFVRGGAIIPEIKVRNCDLIGLASIGPVLSPSSGRAA